VKGDILKNLRHLKCTPVRLKVTPTGDAFAVVCAVYADEGAKSDDTELKSINITSGTLTNEGFGIMLNDATTDTVSQIHPKNGKFHQFCTLTEQKETSEDTMKLALLFINMFCNLRDDPDATNITKWKQNRLFLAITQVRGSWVGRLIEIVDDSKIYLWSKGLGGKTGYRQSPWRKYSTIRNTILTKYKFFDSSRRDAFEKATEFADQKRRLLSPNQRLINRFIRESERCIRS